MPLSTEYSMLMYQFYGRLGMFTSVMLFDSIPPPSSSFKASAPMEILTTSLLRCTAGQSSVITVQVQGPLLD